MRRVSCVLTALLFLLALSAARFSEPTSAAGTEPDCTVEVFPGESIQDAIDAGAPGSVICVHKGDYPETLRCDSGDGGTPDAPVILRGAPGDAKPSITWSGPDQQVLRIACAYFEVRGLDLSGPNVDNSTVIYPASGHDVTIAGNLIHGGRCQGVSMEPSTYDYVIEGNVVYDNGTGGKACDEQAHGLYLKGNYHLVRNNIVRNNHDYGIQRWPSGSGSTIAFNTVVFNGRSGLVLGGSNGDHIVSNIFAYNGAFGIHRGSPEPYSCDIHGNLGWSNPSGDIEGGGWPKGCDGLNFHGDPAFASGADYHLTLGSAAIGLGDLLYAPPFDFDGVERPQGLAPDIGAYEFVG
jgi:hypothetical protein